MLDKATLRSYIASMIRIEYYPRKKPAEADGFVLSIIFSHEDGCDIFLRNI
jgi:hypothetical protein